MAITPSSLEFARKPSRPKLMPRIGTPDVPIWRAVRRMVPSPPSTTVIATPAASAAFTPSWSQRHERSDESTSVYSRPCVARYVASSSDASTACELELLRTMRMCMKVFFPGLL